METPEFENTLYKDLANQFKMKNTMAELLPPIELKMPELNASTQRTMDKINKKNLNFNILDPL